MTALLSELVAIPSVQGKREEGAPFGKEPARALGTMLKRCKEYGFIVENTDNYAGSADINELSPELAVLTHLDVVPVGTGWTGNPFTLKYVPENDKLIGRGTIDDKGPAVAALFAARAIKELGLPLKKGIRLIFGTNEENGSADLAYYREKHSLPKMVFTPDGEYPLINAEKGMLRVHFSSDFFDGEISEIQAGTVINAVPQFCTVIIDGVGVAKEKAVYDGVPAHASTPELGENAITMFLDGYSGENLLLLNLAQLFPHGETDGKSCGLGFSDEISGKMTCVFSLLNAEKGRIKGAVDIRFPLDRKKAEISRIICDKLTEAGFEIDSCEGVEPHRTDENSEFVQTLLRVYERVTGDVGRCIAIGGGTYVHDIDGGVAFGAEFPGRNNNMHSPDEYITTEELLQNAEIMAEAMAELCC